MQVILLEKIQKLGNLGDLAHVKGGYARNFLIPQGKAKHATKANLAEFESMKSEFEAKEASTLTSAKERENAMDGFICNIEANASDEGKLFGSISAADIVKSLADAGHTLEKRDISMPEAIRNVGEYEVNVNLHTDISITIKVVISALVNT